MTSQEAFLALNMVPRLGSVRTRKLLDFFGDPVKVLEAKRDELLVVEGIGNEVADSIRRWQEFADPAAELERVSSAEAHIVTLADSSYPAILREIHDPPIVLYVRGSLPAADRAALAVVGTRQPTIYGGEAAKKLSYQLAYAGLTIVSGLARGIDTAAHQAALAAKGRTIAVIGSGLSKLYPPENAELADRIVASGGAVISEFPMETSADRQTFPMRNRIVSGLSFGILVIEAGASSGALITCNQAGEQGRSIYAVPGKIDSPKSIGANRLIQQGAKLVTCAQDILDDMGLLFRDTPTLQKPAAPSNLTSIERQIFDALGDDESTLDAIAIRARLPVSEVSSALIMLEMKKALKVLPGSRFIKTL